MLAQWPGSVSSQLSVSLFKFITWDKSQLVGLGIPLRFIAKPSYSGHCASTHVVRKLVEKKCPITDKQVNEIVSYFDCGFKCFIHREKMNLISMPDILINPDIDMDKGIWNDEMEEIKNSLDSYVELDKLDFSNESLKIMEDFIEGVTDTQLQDKLRRIIKNPLPLRYFKMETDNSESYRQKWIEFKNRRLIEWVERQLTLNNK